jgi:hypothetical protein
MAAPSMPGLWYLTKLTLCQAIPERPRGDEEGIRRKYVPLAAETRDYSAATAQISSQGFYKQSSGCPSPFYENSPIN